MFDAVVEAVEREYFDRAFLSGPWPAMRDEHRARFAEAESTEDREVVVRSLLGAMGVSHLVLLTPTDQTKIEAADGAPRRLCPKWQRDGDTLYLAIRSCKVPTTTRTDLTAIAEKLAAVRQVVIDLRLNDGGSGGVVSDFVSLFVAPETPVLRMRDRPGIDRDGEPLIVHTFHEEENRDHELEVATLREQHDVEYRTHDWAGFRFEGRIVVLTGPTCYSCGEVLAQAFKEHTDATVVGLPTAGMVVGARQVTLTDDDGLLVPFAEMRSGQGVVLEGEGCVPHIEMDLSGLDGPAVLAALSERDLLE
jgi:C-terminal processing protease CtpA/Prc